MHDRKPSRHVNGFGLSTVHLISAAMGSGRQNSDLALSSMEEVAPAACVGLPDMELLERERDLATANFRDVRDKSAYPQRSPSKLIHDR